MVYPASSTRIQSISTDYHSTPIVAPADEVPSNAPITVTAISGARTGGADTTTAVGGATTVNPIDQFQSLTMAEQTRIFNNVLTNLIRGNFSPDDEEADEELRHTRMIITAFIDGGRHTALGEVGERVDGILNQISCLFDDAVAIVKQQWNEWENSIMSQISPDMEPAESLVDTFHDLLNRLNEVKEEVEWMALVLSTILELHARPSNTGRRIVDDLRQRHSAAIQMVADMKAEAEQYGGTNMLDAIPLVCVGNLLSTYFDVD